MSREARIQAAVDCTGLLGRLLSYSSKAYLVGGFIRDALLGVPSFDIDLVIDDDLSGFVPLICSDINGKILPLWDERISRILTLEGFTIDIARMQGGSIEHDLRLRDFTVNAMAWRPECGIVDPCHGCDDLDSGVLRMVSSANLLDDPLRLLRAYRFLSTKGFMIEDETRMAIRELAQHMVEPAGERITLEIVKMLNAPQPLQALLEALKDGILESVICSNNSMLRHNIQLFSRIDSYLYLVPEEITRAVLPHGFTYAGVLRFEALCLGAGIINMTLSRAMRERLVMIEANFNAVSRIVDPLCHETFDIIRRCGEVCYDLMVLAGRPELLPHVERYLSNQRLPLMKTEEIMHISGAGEGPGLGLLLQALSFERYAGKVRNRSDVSEWLGGYNLT